MVFGLGELGAYDEGKGSVAHSGFDLQDASACELLLIKVWDSVAFIGFRLDFSLCPRTSGKSDQSNEFSKVFLPLQCDI